jgi:hemolysin activation/secretion protein
LAAFFTVSASAASPVVPDAGSILQQIQPVTPPPASSTAIGLDIEGNPEGKPPPSFPFMVKGIRISGNTLFSTATLHALVADAEGKSLTLSKLGELATRVTNYYHAHGYLLARAIIPAQVIQDGVVVVEVSEARYGAIRLDNHSRVNDALLENTLSPLESGQPVEQSKLDHSLLLLADIPGVAVNATLKAGENAGTSDLLVNAASCPIVSGNVVLDNYGNPYTGRVQVGETAELIEPLHIGDILSANTLSSGRGINFGRIAYESLLDGEGTRMGASYSALHYIVGGPLSDLDAHGTAQIESLWAKQTFVRSRNVNLYGQIQYDRMRLSDDIDVGALQTDRHLENWTLSLAGDARDRLLSHGITIWRFDWTGGRDRFDNLAAQLADAATARTQEGFSKGTANIYRLQSLSPKDELYLAFTGQWANGDLDSSEKMTAGGPNTVRAYDMGAISGDTGYLGTAEFRHDLGRAWKSQWQAVAFIDSANVTVNKTIWVTGPNGADLSGAGVGLNWVGPNRWDAKICIAKPIGPIPALVTNAASSRLWIETSKGF